MATLDDLKNITNRDKSDALGIAAKHWQQYKHAFDFKWEPVRPVHNVVLAGMGGSGLAATAMKQWADLSIPFEVVHDYALPEFINQDTLAIFSSYSGNTEETVSALEAALDEDQPAQLRPMVVVVASGGRLIEIAKEQDLPYVELPGGFQPRMTFGYQFRALAEVLLAAHLLDGAIPQMEAATEWLLKELDNLLPAVPTSQNPAKQLALELMGKSVVVYSGPRLAPAAYKWKISFNENAKTVAWYNQYPEFNHNEFLGWTSHPVDKPYAVVELRSNLEHERVQKRFEVTEKLLSGKRPHPQIVEAQGETVLQQLLWTIQLGDFVSLYLAILNGLDPTPVDLIEKLKTELAG